MPNIQELSLAFPPVLEGTSWARKALALAASETGNLHSSHFTKLRKISYLGHYSLISFNEVVPCFFLPSVETLLVDCCADKYTYLNLDHNRKRIYYPHPKNGSSISTLVLEQSVFKPNILRGIIRQCRALKSFTFSYLNDKSIDFTGDVRFLDPPAFKEALFSAKSSLYELRLGLSAFYFPKSYGLLRPMIHSIGSLKDFLTLSTLDISIIMLLGNREDLAPRIADILPPNLKWLKLRSDRASVWYWSPKTLVERLKAFAVSESRTFQQLQFVDLRKVYEELHSWESQALMLECIRHCGLVSEFKRAGITLIL